MENSGNQKLFQLKAYARYRRNAKRWTQLQSPFLFSFARAVCQDRAAKIPEVKRLRKYLSSDTSSIEKTDFGTGKSKTIATKSLAASSSIRPKYGRLLAKIAAVRQPAQVLEFGTCLGVSSLYASLANPALDQLVSVEGCPATFEKRSQAFEKTGISTQKTTFICQSFDDFLRKDNATYDMIFIDGNHSYEATLNYYQKLWPKLSEDGLLIFDDIHWSLGMEKAWNEISLPKMGQVNLDFFQFGLSFKRSHQASQRIQIHY